MSQRRQTKPHLCSDKAWFNAKSALLIAIVMMLVSPGNCASWVSRQIYYSSSTSGPTYMSKTVSGALNYFNYTQGLFMCFATSATVSAPDNRLKCTNPDATVTGGLNPSTTNVFTLAMKEDLTMIMSGRNPNLIPITITISGSTMTLTAGTTFTSALFVASAINKEGTNYYYFGPSTYTATTNAKFHRFDKSGAGTLTSSTGSLAGVSPVSCDSYNVHIWRDSNLISTGDYEQIVVGAISDLSLTKTFGMGASVYSYASRVDNLNDKYLIYGDCNNGIAKYVDITAGSLTVARTYADATVPAFAAILNMGTLDLFLYVSNGGTAAKEPRLVTKSTFAFVTKLSTAPDYSMIGAGFGAFNIHTDWYSFSSMTQDGSNTGSLYTVYMLNDQCTTRDSSSICSACPTNLYLNSTGTPWNLCWELTRFPDGKGLDKTQNKVVDCKTGCGSCLNNVNICTRCKYSEGYYRYVQSAGVTESCLLYKDIPTGYGVNSLNSSELMVCEKTGCTSCKANHKVCESLSTTSSDSTKDGLENAFEDDKDEYAMTSRVLQWILKLINFLFKIALMPFDFFLPAVIDRHTAFFSFLRVLDGTPMLYPNKIIHFLSSVTFFGFRIPNPHWDWSKDQACLAPTNYLVRGLQCNIFANYGHNIDILWAALFVSSVVFAVSHFLLKKKPDNKFIQLLNKNFGFRYFFIFMDAVLLELFGLCILNFSKVEHKTSAIDGGFAFSFILLIYYLGYYSVTFLSIKYWLDERKKSGDETSVPGEGNHKLALFSFIIADYKPKQMANIFFYMPIILAGKQMLVQILALSLSGQEWGQLVPIVIVEIAYLVLVCIARPKAALIWNIFDIFFASISPIYIFANMGSLTKYMSNEDKQQNAGKAMASFLLICALVTTVYIFARIALVTITLLKAKGKSKVASADFSPSKETDNQIKESPSTSRMLPKSETEKITPFDTNNKEEKVKIMQMETPAQNLSRAE